MPGMPTVTSWISSSEKGFFSASAPAAGIIGALQIWQVSRPSGTPEPHRKHCCIVFKPF
jgi:hypothetical protein